jgi:hypothetical protein
LQFEVDSAKYSAVTLANLPADFASSRPLVFVIDQTADAYYFQIGTDGKFTRVPLFAGIKVQTLSAAVRSKLASGSAFPYYWIGANTCLRRVRSWLMILSELFALGSNGNVYHLEVRVYVERSEPYVMPFDSLHMTTSPT